MTASILGLDIGGANLKAAHSDGTARTLGFALWKQPSDLASALEQLTSTMPPFDRVAVTMTGELCDCFTTSRGGVLHILDKVEESPPINGKPIFVWRNDGQFENIDAARTDPKAIVAANWLALGTFAGQFAPTGKALIVDIGTTTTDLILLDNGVPAPSARTDQLRLKSGELVYTGIRRTPVCALLGAAGAAEMFATMLDAFLLTGQIPENSQDIDTADGRPATKEHAHSRLARMLCGDGESVNRRTTTALAKRLTLMQRKIIERTARKLAAKHGQPQTVVISGSGEFQAREIFRDHVVSLSERLGPERSIAAPAVAVADLLAKLPT